MRLFRAVTAGAPHTVRDIVKSISDERRLRHPMMLPDCAVWELSACVRTHRTRAFTIIPDAPQPLHQKRIILLGTRGV